MLSRSDRLSHAVVAAALVAAATLRPADAADTIHVGKAVPTAFTFTPLDIGKREGIFAKYGLDVEIVNFTGDAKLQQGLTAGSVDFGLGSGPGMAFAAKGAPVRAVADYFGAAANIAVIVKAGSPIKTVADLKGKVMAISTVGSLTDWLTQQIALKQGWGQQGIRITATGGGPAMTSAILAGEVDAGMGSYETGLTLEQKHRAHPLVTMDTFEPRFITHVIFARQALIQSKPDTVRHFVDAFFAVLNYMRGHRAQTVAIADDVLHDGKTVLDGAYDREMPIMSKDGTFDPEALKIIKQSWADMKILPSIPRDDQILTRRFVPVKAQTAVAP
ncbi:MAG TPA: ABC transporter substrate-binding protein [Stellaceae bacterium]|jgi:NitT/TauT family transport system substrate-binding protein|nr:ABC transporter substrate-binding protein [Stellaceae bacterium]